jgi:hypothetical protein
MNERQLQVLRAIDKCGRIGREGVVALLQKGPEEFGAGLDAVSASLIGLFLGLQGRTNEETVELASGFARRARQVRSRLALMEALDGVALSDGTTAWERLLAMRQNADQTWRDGGRPANIAWALDDIMEMQEQWNS